MMEKMIALQQKRRSKKGGFTLVELIVVLVILAILAALLIPALTGYIGKAKEKQNIAETRQVVMAAQTLVDEAVAKTDDATNIAKLTAANIKELAEADVATSDKIIVNNAGKVIYVAHTCASGQVCYYGIVNDKSTYSMKSSEITVPTGTYVFGTASN